MRLKKVKGALEKIESSKYYVNSPGENKGKWNQVFDNQHPIHIEIGMGKGHFIIQMAKKYPKINFVGIEMYDSVLVRAIQSLEKEEEIKNLKLLLLDAKNIDNVFENEVDVIYLNFSDPWPKAKHAKRRLTSKVFLDKYETIFKAEKKIIQKTDNLQLFEFSVEMLQENGYHLVEITNDLQSVHDENNVLTEYEAKFMEKCIKINRLIAIK